MRLPAPHAYRPIQLKERDPPKAVFSLQAAKRCQQCNRCARAREVDLLGATKEGITLLRGLRRPAAPARLRGRYRWLN